MKSTPNSSAQCQGPVQRREFLRAGLAAFGSLSLPGLFHWRAQAGIPAKNERTAIIVVWLRGGASHLETYDPKPDAPSEYRGPYKPISTKTPGLLFSELLPRQAALSDKYAILRSMAHTGGGHPSGTLQVLSGDPMAQDQLKPRFMTVANYLRTEPTRKLPTYVGVNPIDRYDNFTIAGPAYLGTAYEPFAVMGDPNSPNFRVPNIGLQGGQQAERLNRRPTGRAPEQPSDAPETIR